MQNENNNLPKSGVVNSFNTIDSVNIYDKSEQNRVEPRQVSTGMTRGQQEVQGTLIVRDNTNGVVRVVIGYEENGF